MSNSHVRSANAIAEAVAYFCQVSVIGDGGLLMFHPLATLASSGKSWIDYEQISGG
jgi:hypothetical protein